MRGWLFPFVAYILLIMQILHIPLIMRATSIEQLDKLRTSSKAIFYVILAVSILGIAVNIYGA